VAVVKRTRKKRKMSRRSEAHPLQDSPEPEPPIRDFNVGPNVGKIGHAFETLWKTVGPYLASNMADRVVTAPGRGAGDKQELTLLFADICGFTAVAEQMDPQECVNILNAYFGVAVEAVLEFGGTVDKFQGDSIMATFAAAPGGESHQRRAVKCAIRIRSTIQNLAIPQLPLGRIRLGIGISTGIAAVGNVGPISRRDFTAIGDVVNVAHRLQSISEPGQIVISEETRQSIGEDLQVEALGTLKLKGRIEPVAAYLVQ
jgi:adenylate cyclase